MIKTKEELYDYIVKEYKLNSIKDCYKFSTCPETIDLTDIIVPKDFDITELFSVFSCKKILLPKNITTIGN